MTLDEIKNKRKEVGLSQQELADNIELNRSTLSLIENGKRKPSYEVMSRISKALKEPIEIK